MFAKMFVRGLLFTYGNEVAMLIGNKFKIIIV